MLENTLPTPDTEMDMDKLRKLFDEKLDPIQRNLSEMNNTLNLVVGDITNLQKTTDILHKDQTCLQEKILDLESRLQESTRQNHELQQYTRKTNLIISGIPEEEGETTKNLREKVKKLANIMEVTLEDRDIQATHRLPAYRPRGNAPRQIVVKINDYFLREDFIMAVRRRARADRNSMTGPQLGFPTAGAIYINHQLAPYFGKLLSAAKSLVRNKTVFSQAFFRKDAVHLRRDNDTQVYVAHTFEELEELHCRFSQVFQDPGTI